MINRHAVGGYMSGDDISGIVFLSQLNDGSDCIKVEHKGKILLGRESKCWK